MKSIKIFRPFGLIILIMGLAGCSQSNTQIADESTGDDYQDIWLETAPEQSLSVSEARGLSAGEVITVEGVIGGVLEPFTEGFAVFVLADDALVFCNEMSDEDHCKTPWDACCEPSEVRLSSIASVQVINVEGMPIAKSAKTAFGLNELDKITVVGVVAPESTADNLIISATGIHKAG